jgi:iron-sulfur cluster assembly protein
MKELPIKISERALAEIRVIFATKNIPPNYGLRIGIRGGGCGAAGFSLGFDQPQSDDMNWTVETLTVLIDKRHLMYVLDLELDFEEHRDERGFVFHRPQEKQAVGS